MKGAGFKTWMGTAAAERIDAGPAARPKFGPWSMRPGYAMLEVAAAAAMLGALLFTAVQVFRVVAVQQRSAAREVVALQIVQALAEQVGNMSWEELTPEAMAKLALPGIATQNLPDAKLAVEVADETEPVAAKRITIALTWNTAPGRTARPLRLTSWVFRDAL